MQNSFDPTADHISKYLSMEQFVFLCPLAFQLHVNHSTLRFGQQGLSTEIGITLVSPATNFRVPPENSFGGAMTSMNEPSNNEGTIYQSSGESSTSSPQISVLEDVNSSSGGVHTSDERDISTPVNSQADPRFKVTCGVCEKQVLTKNFVAHLEVHDPCRNQHICGICEKAYFHVRDLTKHRKDKVHYAAPGTDKHVCGICDESFTCVQKLKTHRKKFLCVLF